MRNPSAPLRRRGPTLLGGAVLLAGTLVLLWINLGFARYALTGFFWAETGGTVLNACSSSSPTIQFTTPDGAAHTFSEDYILLCGRRSLCFVRDFSPGQAVPVVYDPSAPQYAYIHDWALTSNVILWFFEAALALLFAALLAFALRRRPLNLSIRIGSATKG